MERHLWATLIVTRQILVQPQSFHSFASPCLLDRFLMVKLFKVLTRGRLL